MREVSRQLPQKPMLQPEVAVVTTLGELRTTSTFEGSNIDPNVLQDSQEGGASFGKANPYKPL